MQLVVDVSAIAIMWVVGIICILITKKIQPETYKAYALYDLTICGLVTVSAILYLYQR